MEQFSRNRIWWQDYDAIRMLSFLYEIAQQMQDNGATTNRLFEFEQPTCPVGAAPSKLVFHQLLKQEIEDDRCILSTFIDLLRR